MEVGSGTPKTLAAGVSTVPLAKQPKTAVVELKSEEIKDDRVDAAGC